MRNIRLKTFFEKKNKKLSLLLLCLVMLSGCNAKTADISVDESAIKYLNNMKTLDVKAAAEKINEMDKNRRAIAEAKRKEEIAEDIHRYINGEEEASGVLTKGEVLNLREDQIPKLRNLFSDTIVIGNSRARSIIHSGILTNNEVIFKPGSTVDEMMNETVQGAHLYRGKALFIMGINDLGYYVADVAGFKRDYIALIDAYRGINPTGEIYLQEIIPIHEKDRYRWYNMDRVVDYNAAIREICEEKNCTFVSSVEYALEEFLSDDTGAHYDRRYHIYWAQAMANQMNLWGD